MTSVTRHCIFHLFTPLYYVQSMYHLFNTLSWRLAANPNIYIYIYIYINRRFPETSWRLKHTWKCSPIMRWSPLPVRWCSSRPILTLTFWLLTEVFIFMREKEREKDTAYCHYWVVIDEIMPFWTRTASLITLTIMVFVITSQITKVGFTFRVRPSVVAQSVPSYILPEELQNAITNNKKTNQFQVTPFAIILQ